MDNDTYEIAARLRQAVTRVHRRLRASALGDVTPSQASMLASIEKLGNPSLGDLAVAEQIQPPSVTRMAQGLETAGLITLVADTHDRRCTRAQLTATGRREIAGIRKRKTEFLENRLSELSREDRRTAEIVASFLEQLLDES